MCAPVGYTFSRTAAEGNVTFSTLTCNQRNLAHKITDIYTSGVEFQSHPHGRVLVEILRRDDCTAC